jgi:group II intron reverse transcriptase/maturase
MNSNSERRKQITPKGACLREDRATPESTAKGLSFESASSGSSLQADERDLMERILSSQNLIEAMERVSARKGKAPGVDGMVAEELRDYLIAQGNGLTIVHELRMGTYRPKPVRRVEIPKPGGGTRQLGLPTTVDKWVQQAILQVLSPIFEETFSDSSYGFRPGRSTHQAILKAAEYIQAGYHWVVDTDISKFFDNVNHDILMAKVARTIDDKRVLRLIRRYLEAGAMADGVVWDTKEGTPQGGPLSPLLSNIMLTDFDREMERRGHRLVRYADDANVYVKTRRAGERVLRGIKSYLATRLRLRVNDDKSAVDQPTKRQFLGFSFYYGRGGEVRLRISDRAERKLKAAVRETTSKTDGKSLAQTIRKLNERTVGWVTYYAKADAKNRLAALDEWIRRKLRAKQWKHWKRTKPRHDALRRLGLSEEAAWNIAKTQKGTWRASKTPQVHEALNNAYWRAQGLKPLSDTYKRMHQS